MADRMILAKHSLRDLWFENPDFTITQSVFIGLFFLVMGIVIYAVIWYLQLGFVMDLGYPKPSKRQKRQGERSKKHAFGSKLFLWKLCKNAPKKHFFLWFAFGMNLLNMIAFAVSVAAYIGAIVTNGAGWSMTLLLFTPDLFLLFVTVVEYIPSILFIPSERRRHGLFDIIFHSLRRK